MDLKVKPENYSILLQFFAQTFFINLKSSTIFGFDLNLEAFQYLYIQF